MEQTPLQQHLDDFRANGYTIVRNAVAPDYLAELQSVTAALLEEGKDTGRNLLAAHPIFGEMIDGHAGLPILEALIPDLQLLALDMRTCHPGKGDMDWHADIGFFSNGSVVSINTALYLDDLTPNNGALRVLPGSHLRRFDLSADQLRAELAGEVLVQVPAGSMVIFSDNLWHRTGTNHSDRVRRGIFTYYGHFWMKPTAYADRPVALHAMEQYLRADRPKRRQLLGMWLDGSEFNRAEAMG